MMRRIELGAVLLAGAVALTACDGDKRAAQNPDAVEKADTALPTFEIESQLPPSLREAVLKPFTGDLDEIIHRRAVRLGVAFNRTFYFVDKGAQRGIAYEYGRLMEARLNKRFKTGRSNKIHVIFLPLPREMDVPFTHAVSVISRWGAGSHELVDAMQPGVRVGDIEHRVLVASDHRPALPT